MSSIMRRNNSLNRSPPTFSNWVSVISSILEHNMLPPKSTREAWNELRNNVEHDDPKVRDHWAEQYFRASLLIRRRRTGFFYQTAIDQLQSKGRHRSRAQVEIFCKLFSGDFLRFANLHKNPTLAARYGPRIIRLKTAPHKS